MKSARRLVASLTFSCLGLVLAALPSAAQVSTGFCASYTQISSNAGACNSCTIQVNSDSPSQRYFVTSSNGWTATGFWVEGDFSVMSGSGQWPGNMGAYSNQTFDFDLIGQGDQATMAMTHHNAQLGVVQAVFQCN